MVWGRMNQEAEARESLFWTRTRLGDHGGSHWEVMCPVPGYDSRVRVDQAMGSVDQREDTLCSLGLDFLTSLCFRLLMALTTKRGCRGLNDSVQVKL